MLHEDDDEVDQMSNMYFNLSSKHENAHKKIKDEELISIEGLL